MSRGKYIVIEGPAGVGKTTQVDLLTAALDKAGLAVRVLREPDNQHDLTAHAIQRLIENPHYPMNSRAETLLYNAARAQSLETIRDSVEQGIMCVVDGNHLSALTAHYYGRGDVPDYDKINAIIRFAVGDLEPDLTIVLDAEVATLRERLRGRSSGERFDNLDETFLERVRAGYLWEAKQRGLPVVYAVDGTEAVFKEVWRLAAESLAQREPKSSAMPAVVAAPQSIAEIIAERQALKPTVQDKATPELASDEPLLTKNPDGNFAITTAGTTYLNGVVTNSESNVYAFTDTLSPTTIAAAMARLSRRGDDLRVTILDEFAKQLGTDEKLLQRVITAYGDDSVQQLVGQHVVVEGASNLLTKKLEWGRLAAYLEQSTRYMYFDQKDAAGNYKYYTPEDLSPKLKKTYRAKLDAIFDLYSEIVHKLTDHIQQSSKVPAKERDGAWKAATRAQACDAARPLLPVATKATVGMYASGQALESLILHLMSDELPEARGVGQQLLDESRKVIPVFLERADQPDRGGAWVAYRATTNQKLHTLADKFLPDQHTNLSESVQLTDYWPKNELELVPDMLYEHSNLSLAELKAQVNAWPYERKVEVFNAYMGERLGRRHRPGRALEKAHYSWDLLCDYGIFRDLQRHRIVDDLEWQLLTPRYGYETPRLVEEAGLSDQFDTCFDLSLELYSALQAAGHELEAQYATLLGHQMRWKVTYNAREAFHLHELRTSPQGHPGYRKLVLAMHAKLAEVHPLMATAMKFVNQGEDAELTRLAAERAAQSKLKNLDSKKPRPTSS